MCPRLSWMFKKYVSLFFSLIWGLVFPQFTPKFKLKQMGEDSVVLVKETL